MTGSETPKAGPWKPEPTDWTRMWFKTNKVWMAVDGQGKPIVKDGKVLIKYQLKQDYEYWVNRTNVKSIDSPPPKKKFARKTRARSKNSSPGTAPEGKMALRESSLANKICVYTDGASAGNPGPAGIGIFLRYGKHEREISEYLGTATNNVAELKAIRAGLLAVKDRMKPVRLFTDSQYAFGLLVLNWKARKNQKIVDSIKQTMHEFKDLEIIKVKGHAGLPGNEKADFLATSAIKRARRSKRKT